MRFSLKLQLQLVTVVCSSNVTSSKRGKTNNRYFARLSVRAWRTRTWEMRGERALKAKSMSKVFLRFFFQEQFSSRHDLPFCSAPAPNTVHFPRLCRNSTCVRWAVSICSLCRSNLKRWKCFLMTTPRRFSTHTHQARIVCFRCQATKWKGRWLNNVGTINFTLLQNIPRAQRWELL